MFSLYIHQRSMYSVHHRAQQPAQKGSPILKFEFQNKFHVCLRSPWLACFFHILAVHLKQVRILFSIRIPFLSPQCFASSGAKIAVFNYFNPSLSRHGAQTPRIRRPDSSPHSLHSPGMPGRIPFAAAAIARRRSSCSRSCARSISSAIIPPLSSIRHAACWLPCACRSSLRSLPA